MAWVGQTSCSARSFRSAQSRAGSIGSGKVDEISPRKIQLPPSLSTGVFSRSANPRFAPAHAQHWRGIHSRCPNGPISSRHDIRRGCCGALPHQLVIIATERMNIDRHWPNCPRRHRHPGRNPDRPGITRDLPVPALLAARCRYAAPSSTPWNHTGRQPVVEWASSLASSTRKCPRAGSRQ
jgi:hypothetical protein